MKQFASILSFSAAATFFIAIQASAEVPLSMTTEWTLNQPIIVSGSNVDGDDPYYNKICIASVADKANPHCYDPDDSKDGLTLEKWDNSTLTFYAPADIPPEGILTLKVRTTVQTCYDYSGCYDHDEDTNREIGNYKAYPYVSELIDVSSDEKVFSLKQNRTYQIKGAFFGENKGKLFLQYSNGSTQIDPGSISSWSYDEIVFRTPSGIEPIGFSVNNGALATKHDLIVQSSPSSSAKQVSSSSSSSEPHQDVQEQSSLFTDVESNNPYAAAILWAKQSGVLQGYPDGSFRADNVVNRAEFLKIVLGAKGINVSDASGSSGFIDVDENGWYAPYVRYAKSQGIIQGYPDGTFKPEQTVNFAEALKMAYNALGVFTNDIGGNWYDRYLQHALLNSVLFTTNVSMESDMSRKDVVWIAWKLMTAGGEWQQPAAVPSSTASTNTASLQFGDGTFVVGQDIQAGTYRTRVGTAGCYFARLSGFSGELDDVTANELTNVPTIVTIAATDKGFKSQGCGTWTQDLSAITTSKTSFGDGVFIVGTDISPGTYKNSGGSSCYYSRLGGFSGSFDDIIANELTDAAAIVTISSTDKGFKSQGCGTWNQVQ